MQARGPVEIQLRNWRAALTQKPSRAFFHGADGPDQAISRVADYNPGAINSNSGPGLIHATTNNFLGHRHQRDGRVR